MANKARGCLGIKKEELRMKTTKLLSPRYVICKTLTEHCVWLDKAHKDKTKHDKLKKTIKYQRYIGEMNELNKLSKKFGSGCQCKEIKGKKEHLGHRMVKK